MNHRISLFLLVVCAAVPAQAELLPPPPVSIAASLSGRYFLRCDYNFEFFERSADEKTYRLVSQFHSEDRFAIKALISEEGPLIVVFGHTYEKPKAGERDEIVCTYSPKGELLRTWRLDEILSKEDLELLVSHSDGGSLWLYHEVGIFESKRSVVFVGPTGSDHLVEKRYVYLLDLKSGTWEQGREEILKKKNSFGFEVRQK
jgi:hypothetical protein